MWDEERKKKILIIVTTRMGMGGISAVILNYYKNMDKDYFQMDFVIKDYIDPSYRKILEDGNSRIHLLPRERKPLLYMFRLFQIVKKNAYDVVHVHGNSATMILDLMAVRLGGCKYTIAHSHNSDCVHKTAHILLKYPLKLCYTKALACSDEAGKWVFVNSQYTVLPNGIDVEKYQYSELIRREVRKQLGLDGKLVLGHVGFMSESKNHEKLLEILFEMKKNNKDVHLLCITGSEMVPEHLQNIIYEKNLSDSVTVLYKRTDVHRLLQAMDVFVFPSKYEGLGMVVLEAQAAGVPCVVSDRVPSACNITGSVKFVNLNSNNREWEKVIYEQYSDQTQRMSGYEKMRESIYNIKNCSGVLQDIYLHSNQKNKLEKR